jgi:hypothetical protein
MNQPSRLNMRLLYPFLLCAGLHAQTLYDLKIGSTPATFVSSGSAQTQVTAEFRALGAASVSYITSGSGLGAVNCLTNSSLSLLCEIGGVGTPICQPAYTLTNAGDYRVRYIYDSIAQTNTLEVFPGAGGSALYNTTCTATGGQTVALGATTWTLGPSVQLSFLRLYSGIVGSGSGVPVDAPTSPANLFDFVLENSGGSAGSPNDRSGNGYMLGGISPASSCGSAPCYTPSTVYNPTANIGGWTTYKPVFLAGQSSTFSSTSFCSAYPGTGGCASFAWTQTAGPAMGTFGSASSANTTFTTSTGGQYTLHLVATDSASNTGSASQIIGEVATNPDGTAVVPANVAIVLEPMVPFGTKWPWDDATKAQDVDLLSSLMETPPTETAGPGTCGIPSTSPNTLNGGQIQASMYGSIAIVCSGSNFTPADVNTWVAVDWICGSGFTCHLVQLISQYVSATTVVGNSFFLAEPPASIPSGLTWGRMGADFGPWILSGSGSNILGFYEAGLGVARLFYQTQLTTYQTQWHDYCTNLWAWSLDGGYSTNMILRNSQWQVLLACAADSTYTAPNTSVGTFGSQIAYNVNLNAGSAYAGINPTMPVVVAETIDPREYSYTTRATAKIAQLASILGVTQSTWCGYLANQVTYGWLDGASQPVGYPANTYSFMPEDIYRGNISLPGAGVVPGSGPPPTFGTAPWRSDTLPDNALIQAYAALGGCTGQSSLAAMLFAPGGTGGLGTGLIPQIANYVLKFGRSADGGLFGAASYADQTVADGGSALISNWYDYMAPNFHYDGQTVTYAGGAATAVAGVANVTIFTHQFWAGATIGIGGQGTVNTSGTAVTWVSGSHFVSGLTSITIGSTTYSISTYNSPTSITLSTSAGSQTGAGFSTSLVNCTVASVTNDYTMALNSGCAAPDLSGGVNWGNPNTIAVVNNSTAVVGTFTHFTTQFGSGWTFICIYNAADTLAGGRNCFGVTVVDDTHLTLNYVYPGVSISGLNTWLVNNSAPSNCGPMSIVTLCSPDGFNGLNLTGDGPASAAWLYNQTGAAYWLNAAIYYLNHEYGGPAGGVGTIGPPSGSAVSPYVGCSVAFSASGTTVTGTGSACHFTSQFSAGTSNFTAADGVSAATWDTYANSNNPSGTPPYYTVAVSAISSDTSMTISAWPGIGTTGTNMFYNSQDPNWLYAANGGNNNLGYIVSAGVSPHYGKELGQNHGSGDGDAAIAFVSLGSNSTSAGPVSGAGVVNGQGVQ